MEANPLRRKDLFLILGIAALVVLLFAISRLLPRVNALPNGGQLSAEITQSAAPSPSAGPADTPASEDAQPPQMSPGNLPALEQADAYLSVQIGQTVYDPIPLSDANEMEIVQGDGKRNVVSFTPESIVMKEASCDNQDCVQQGEVTFINLSRRVLGNMIICLPNQVVLSLLSPLEAQNQWEQLYGGTDPVFH